MSQLSNIELPSSQARAFTLIELLMVVAIIALLVSILVPALYEARNSAKIVVCANNQRQIGIAWKVYLSSNDNIFPLCAANIQWFYGGKEPCIASGGPVLPYRPLNPYLSMREKDEHWAEVFRCPGDRPVRGVTHGHSTFDYFGNSYMMNFFLLVPWDSKDKRYVWFGPDQTRLGDMEFSPSRVVLLGDCQWYYTVNGAQWDAQFHSPPDHMNLAFLDGHASFTRVYRPGEVAAGERPDYIFSPHRE